MHITKLNISKQEYQQYLKWVLYFHELLKFYKNIAPFYSRVRSNSKPSKLANLEAISDTNLDDAALYYSLDENELKIAPNQFILKNIKIADYAFIFDETYYIEFNNLNELCALNDIIFANVRVTVLYNMLIFSIIQDTITKSTILIRDSPGFRI